MLCKDVSAVHMYIQQGETASNDCGKNENRVKKCEQNYYCPMENNVSYIRQAVR